MSLYRKSWLFTAWVLLVFFSFPLWMTLLAGALGRPGWIVGAAFWLSHGAIMMYLFRCPECGLSPYLSNKGFLAWSTPWPRKICGHCGRDHTMDE
jgi:hypothetical protein